MSPPVAEPSPSPANEALHVSKRRKTQLACDPCRARKTGCDGHRPYCNSCLTRGWQERCSYQETILQSSSSAPTLASLNRRLQKLEETAQAQGTFVSSATPQTIESAETIDFVGYHRSYDRDNTPRKATNLPVEPVYGPSSNASFVQQVASVAGSGYEHVDSTGIGIGLASSSGTTIYNVKEVVLPPRPLADSLLQCYWELFHPLFPILHQPTFHTLYTQLWEPLETSRTAAHGRTLDGVFHSTLNVVLALGCQRSEALAEAEREDLAGEFYRRSVRLVPMDFLDVSSLEIVQLLVLRGFYLLYTPHADRCWTTVGVALRVAQAMALQLERTTGAFSQIEREIRRRVWHVCVFLDWMVSLAFDRPRALSRDNPVSMPELVDDEYLSDTAEGQQPQGIPSRLSFFVHGMKLIDIREKYQTQHSDPRRGRYTGQELGATLDLISDLDHFVESIPPYLKTDHSFAVPTSGSESCFKLQARVLKSRVMYVRLNMLRPFLVAEANRYVSATAGNRDPSGSASSVQNSLYKDLCTLCVSVAHDAIEEIHHLLSTAYRSSPWHNLYFTFTAASVLVAATLCPYLSLQLDQGPCKTSWDKAMHIFAFHKPHVASAEKGMEALKRFKNHVETRGTATRERRRSTLDGFVGAHIPSMTSDSSSFGQNLPVVSEFADPVPLDESWLVHDFLFDDAMIQWQ